MPKVETPNIIEYFMDLFGSNWDYDFPINTQWIVAIEPDANINGNSKGLSNIIETYTELDISNFIIPSSIQKKLLNEKTQPNIDGLGLYFAQSIKMPKEAFAPTAAGIDGMGGYMKGAIASDRIDMTQKELSIDFLETQLDFTDGLMRPWVIAASYRGLIQTKPTNSIKARITIQEFGRERAGIKRPIRKTHIFKDCVPYSVSEKTLKYDQNEIRLNTVNWTFNHYTYELDPARKSPEATRLNYAPNISNLSMEPTV